MSTVRAAWIIHLESDLVVFFWHDKVQCVKKPALFPQNLVPEDWFEFKKGEGEDDTKPEVRSLRDVAPTAPRYPVRHQGRGLFMVEVPVVKRDFKDHPILYKQGTFVLEPTITMDMWSFEIKQVIDTEKIFDRPRRVPGRVYDTEVRLEFNLDHLLLILDNNGNIDGNFPFEKVVHRVLRVANDEQQWNSFNSPWALQRGDVDVRLHGRGRETPNKPERRGIVVSAFTYNAVKNVKLWSKDTGLLTVSQDYYMMGLEELGKVFQFKTTLGGPDRNIIHATTLKLVEEQRETALYRETPTSAAAHALINIDFRFPLDLRADHKIVYNDPIMGKVILDFDEMWTKMVEKDIHLTIGQLAGKRGQAWVKFDEIENSFIFHDFKASFQNDILSQRNRR